MTLAAIGLFLANAWGWLYANRKIILIGAGILLVAIVLVFAYRGCKTRAARIDLEQLEKINKANEAERKAELKEIVEQNADVIKTIDERNTLSDVTIEQRSEEAEKKVEEANKFIEDRKRVGGDVTQEELQCLLIPENCK